MKTKQLSLFALILASTILTGCVSNGSSSNPSSSSSSSVSNTSQQRVFTLTELAQYNGDNGTDAYIAVNGIVYDVTDADGWNNGWHKGMHLAGTDATAAFEGSPHSASILSGLPIVGVLEA